MAARVWSLSALRMASGPTRRRSRLIGISRKRAPRAGDAVKGQRQGDFLAGQHGQGGVQVLHGALLQRRERWRRSRSGLFFAKRPEFHHRRLL